MPPPMCEFSFFASSFPLLYKIFTIQRAKLQKKIDICKKKAQYSLKNLDFNLKTKIGLFSIGYWREEGNDANDANDANYANDEMMK